MPKAHKWNTYLQVPVATVYTDVICILCLLWVWVKQLLKESLYFCCAGWLWCTTASFKVLFKLNLGQYIYRIEVAWSPENQIKDKCLKKTHSILLQGNVIKSFIISAKHLSTYLGLHNCQNFSGKNYSMLWRDNKGITIPLLPLLSAQD